MSETETSPNPKKASASTKPASDHGKAAIQAEWDEANTQGFWGDTPDETPNDAYTVAGVTRKAKGGK